jgi:hypothetical protein
LQIASKIFAVQPNKIEEAANRRDIVRVEDSIAGVTAFEQAHSEGESLHVFASAFEIS